MFFTDDVLATSGGKFAIIWLAAMRKNRVKKKDYESVDLTKTCRELRKQFKPGFDGRMTTIKGFSLRLSAQLVYGVSVVYNMKVCNLYKDANLSLQSLYRFQSQLKIYAIDIPPAPVTADPEENLLETYRDQEPIYGNLSLGIGGVGSPPQPSSVSSDSMNGATSDLSEELHAPRLDIHARRADLSIITMPDDIPTYHRVDQAEFGDDLHIYDKDEPLGLVPRDFEAGDLWHGDEFQTVLPGVDVPAHTATAAQNITTPAAAVLVNVEQPAKPQKAGKKGPGSKSSDDSLLAVPLPSVGDVTIDTIGEPVVELFGNATSPIQIPPEIVVPEVDLPHRDLVTSSEETSASTLDLVLDVVQLSSPKARRRHLPTIVDERTELDSMRMRNQLRALNKCIADYIAEGNLVATLDSPPPAKELFKHPSVEHELIAPSRRDPYSTCKRQPYYRYEPTSGAQMTFDQAVENINQDPSPFEAFSAHREILEDGSIVFSPELLRPEDEYSALPEGPSFDTTMTTSHNESILRNLSRISSIAPSFVESHPGGPIPGSALLDNVEGLSTADIDVTMGQPELEPIAEQTWLLQQMSSLSETLSLSHKNKKFSSDLFARQIRERENEGENVLFSSLAPPHVTARSRAAQIFSNVLMLAKVEKVVIKQEVPYGEIRIQSTAQKH